LHARDKHHAQEAKEQLTLICGKAVNFIEAAQRPHGTSQAIDCGGNWEDETKR